MLSNTAKNPIQLAEITTRLFNNCQEKEVRHAAKFGVSVAEFRCLQVLMEAEKLTVNQLAKKMSLSSGRISRLVDKLVAKQLVTREGGTSDRRIYYLRLSEKGGKLANALVQSHIEIHNDIMDKIDVQYHDPMIKILTLLNNAVENWLELNK